MKGKLIVIEGTDCSGKETQTKLLTERLNQENIKAVRIYNPVYDSPTGRIIGTCILGKPEMCEKYLKENHGFFPEGGGNIDALTASAYYVADRRYNQPNLIKLLEEGYIVLADRYVSSNMAHRGGQIENREDRLKFYEKIEKLEYELFEIIKPDNTILLYLPYEYACELKKKRSELPDEAEINVDYLIRSENAYLELADLYNYEVINCVKDNKIRTINDINDEVYQKVKKLIK